MDDAIARLSADKQMLMTNAQALGGVQQVEKGYMNQVETNNGNLVAGLKQFQAGIGQLENGSNYITKSVNNLENYYSKTETYNSDINSLDILSLTFLRTVSVSVLLVAVISSNVLLSIFCNITF